MNLIRKIIPNFLNELDQKLLISYPLLWSFKLHYNLYFLLLLNIASILLGLIYPVSTDNIPEIEIIFGLTVVPTLAYLGVWLFQLNKFNIETSFGSKSTYEETFKFIVHMISVWLIASLLFALPLTVNYKIAHLVTDEELGDDIDVLNKADHFFSLQHNYYLGDKDFLSERDYYDGRNSNHYRYNKTSRLTEAKERLALAKSGEITRDSVKIYEGIIKQLHSELVLRPSQPTKYSPFSTTDWDESDWLKNKDWPATFMQIDQLKEYHVKNHGLEDVLLSDIENFQHCFIRYGGELKPYDSKTVYANHEAWVTNPLLHLPTIEKHSYTDRISYNWHVSREEHDAIQDGEWEVEHNIRDIVKSKRYNFDFFEHEFYLIALFFITFGITVLFFLYRYVPWKQFVMFVVASAIVPIIIGILTALLNSDSFAQVVYIACFAFTLLLTLMVPMMRHASAFRTVVVMMSCAAATFFLPSMAGIFNDLFYLLRDYYIELFHAPIHGDYPYYYDSDTWMIIWFGNSIVFIFIILPLYKKALLHSISLPKKS